ncbi:MAG: Sir2 family NAD-dependent protein deacetylase, partial [Chloroflexota bacterium]
AAFRQMPQEVWAWYLYRRGVCRQASPNPGHQALVQLEHRFGDRFRLITQNVDGLHLRAGNTLGRTYQIHGNVDYMRCAQACTDDITPIPEAVPFKAKGESLTEADQALLRCPACNGWARPHVLWFDEFYNEVYFRFQSSLQVAEEADLLMVIGTSGSTNLPHQVALRVAQVGGLLLDINPETNPFSEYAIHTGGYFLPFASGEILPDLVTLLTS